MKKMVIDEYRLFLNQCLDYGTIRIGAGPETLFHAFFVSHEKQTIEAHSDRGFDHLLLILISRILKMPHIYTDAQSLYPYPLGIGRENEFERLLAKGNAHMIMVKESIHIHYYRSTSFSLNELPGTYARYGFGSSVVEASCSVLTAHDVLVSCIGDVPPLI
jgi:hypothetical protein